MTLHEEIVAILKEVGHGLMTKEIAEKVNERGNYHKRDGSSVTPFQIHGRTKNYPKLFTREGNYVGLVEWEGKKETFYVEPDSIVGSVEFSLSDAITLY